MVIFQDRKVSAVASQGLLLDQDLRFVHHLSLEMVVHSESLQVMYFGIQRLFKLQTGNLNSKATS